MRLPSVVLVSLIVMFSAAGAMAQDNPSPDNPPAQSPNPTDPFAMWNVQQMIDRASGQVVKRYKLTPEQEDFTRKLMATGVNTFLDKHEQEIRDIFAEAIKYQISGNPPPPDKVKEWTAQITPMFDEAKTQILEGNRQFREVLTDDQKKIHDIDLRVMEQNFKDADKRLTRWREGGYDPNVDFGPQPKPGAQPQPAAVKPPPPAPVEPAPAPIAATPPAAPPAPETPAIPTPAPVPAPTRISGPTASSDNSRLGDLWEMYVRKFIDNYRLEQAQANQALQILDDARKQAGEYLTSHKSDYEKLQTQLAGAAGDQKAMAEINKQIIELNKPVQVAMFNDMKLRLDKIPTDAQRKAFEESQPRRGSRQAAQPHGALPAGRRGPARRLPAAPCCDAPRRPGLRWHPGRPRASQPHRNERPRALNAPASNRFLRNHAHTASCGVSVLVLVQRNEYPSQ